MLKLWLSCFILFVFAALSNSNNVLGQIIIHEVCTKNDYTLHDIDQNLSDWIELYNPSSEMVSLAGYHLTDNPDNLLKWAFPDSIIMAPNTYLVILASGLDMVNNYVHTNFKLTRSEPEQLILTNSNGTIEDVLLPPVLPADHSYGYFTDDALAVFDLPTPNAANIDYITDVSWEETVSFSEIAGFFEAPVVLSLGKTENSAATIRYEFGGKTVTYDSPEYVESLDINQTTVICARLFDGRTAAHQTICESFFFDANYVFPVVSLITDPSNLFSEEKGIYILGPNADSNYPFYGANFWLESKIPASFEFFDEDKNLMFNQQLNLKLHGGRSSRNKPMKAIRLLSGDSEVFDFPFFKDKDIADFEKLILRNASSDFNKLHFRDAVIHKMLIPATDIDVLAYQPVIVYLNGNYWGIHNLRERVDRFYIANNHAVDADEVILLEEDSLIINGDFDDYNDLVDYFNNNDLTLDAHYEAISERLDISSYIDYLSTQIYFGNIDWPRNNLKYWRPINEGGKWRYLFFDLDVSLNGNPFAPVDIDLIGLLLKEGADDVKFIQIFQSILENRVFLESFTNRYADLLNSLFTTENMETVLLNQMSILDSQIDQHFDKWNSGNRDIWQEELDLAMSFVLERPDLTRQNFKNQLDVGEENDLQLSVFPENTGNIQVNSLQLSKFPWSGVYFSEVPIQLSAKANERFAFDYWLINGTDTLFTQNITQQWAGIMKAEAVFKRTDNEAIELSISPNISSNNQEISFEFYNNKNNTINYSVYAVNGQLVWSYEEELNQGIHLRRLPTNLAKGGYVLSVKMGEEEVLKKFFIQ